MQLVLSKDEVKNNVDLEYPLAPSTMALIDIYMKEYQPLLCGDSEFEPFVPRTWRQAEGRYQFAPTDHRCCLEARWRARPSAFVSPPGGDDLPGSASRRL